MDLRALDKHRVVLGWCYVVMNGLGLFFGLVALALIVGGGRLAQDPDARGAVMLVSGLLVAVVLLFLLPGLIAGLGLLKRKPWSKVLALVMGVLNLANVPMGTALFAYTLWFCLQENVNTLFHRHGTPPRMGPPTTPRPPELPPAGPSGWPARQPT